MRFKAENATLKSIRYMTRGLWWGLVVGLAVAAVILLLRVHFRLRAGVARVRID